MESVKEKITKQEMFKRCLMASIHGNVGVVLYENQVKEDAVLGRLEVIKRTSDHCKPIFHFTDRYCYLDLVFPHEKDGDFLSIYHMYETYLERYTKAVVENEGREIQKGYLMVFDVTSTEEDGITYRISSMIPIFAAKEGSTLKFVFGLDVTTFGADKLDFTEVDKEMEYEIRSQQEELRKLNQKLNEEVLGDWTED